MGLFSWVSGNVQKSKAAATIQQYFEFARRLGSFPGDPALTANRVVELAFNRVPDLASGHLKGYVMAATVLSIVILENDHVEASQQGRPSAFLQRSIHVGDSAERT